MLNTYLFVCSSPRKTVWYRGVSTKLGDKSFLLHPDKKCFENLAKSTFLGFNLWHVKLGKMISKTIILDKNVSEYSYILGVR